MIRHFLALSVFAILVVSAVDAGVEVPISSVQSGCCGILIGSHVKIGFRLPETAGDLNVVVIGWGDTTTTLAAVAVTDDLGNTYAVASPAVMGGGLTQAIYYAANTPGGRNHVRVHWNSTPASPNVRILEYAGVAATNPLDGMGVGEISGTGRTVALSTSFNNDLLVSGTIATATTAPGPPAPGWFQRVYATGADVEDRTGVELGTYALPAPFSETKNWITNAVAFKGAGRVNGGAYTLRNQEPVGDLAYPDSPWNAPLPLSVQQGGQHYAANGDRIAYAALIDENGAWGSFDKPMCLGGSNNGAACSKPSDCDSNVCTREWGFQVIAAGEDLGPGDGGFARYYENASTSNDPWWTITSDNCAYTPNPDCQAIPHGPRCAWGKKFQLPSDANLPSGASDRLTGSWQQDQGQLYNFYSFGPGSPIVVGSCPQTNPPHSGTFDDPCILPGMSACSTSNRGTDNGVNIPGGDSLGDGNAGSYRALEFSNQLIPHATPMGVSCTQPYRGSLSVFPEGGPVCQCGVGVCASSANATNHPPAGALFFLDYTDGQIATMNIPDAQRTLITQFSHYGGYISDTSGQGGMTPSRWESPAAYVTLGQPPAMYTYLAGQATPQTTQTGVIVNAGNEVVADMFNLVDQRTQQLILVNGKDISSHLHMAAPCVALGLSGLTLAQARSLEPNTYIEPPCVGKLVVTLSGTGTGTVTGNPVGNMTCPPGGNRCYRTDENGTTVGLTAVPVGGSNFTGWGGACSGTGGCSVTINGLAGEIQVTANFN